MIEIPNPQTKVHEPNLPASMRATIHPENERLRRETFGIPGGMLTRRAIESHIERTVPLDGVADALRDQGLGHARGKTVVTVR